MFRLSPNKIDLLLDGIPPGAPCFGSIYGLDRQPIDQDLRCSALGTLNAVPEKALERVPRTLLHKKLITYPC